MYQEGQVGESMPAIDVGFGYDKEDYVGKRFHELESTRNIPMVKETASSPQTSRAISPR